MKEALRDVGKQFWTMFEFSPTGMAMVTPCRLVGFTQCDEAQGHLPKESMVKETRLEWRIIQNNPAFQQILGYTDEELQDRSFTEFTHPDDQAQSLQLLQELLLGQRTHFSLEKRYVQKDGCIVWVNASVSVVCDANGLPEYAIATIQNIGEPKQSESDLRLERQVAKLTTELAQTNRLLQQEITERQQAQETLKTQQEFIQNLIDVYPNSIFAKGSFAIVTDINALEAMESKLQQTKEQLQAVLDAVPGCISWVTFDGRYLGVNQHLADILNLSPNAFIGQNVGFLNNSPEFVEFIEQFLANPAQTKNQVIEAQVNGSTRNYLITAQKYHQDALTVLVGIDITERKLAEEQLRQSEAQLRFALDTACMGFWDHNLQTGTITYSDNLERLYGLVPNTYEATQETLLARVHPEDRELVRQAKQRSLETGEESKIEFRVIWLDGSIHWLESKCQVFYDARGNPVHQIGISLDICDRKQADAQIQASLHEKEILLQEIHHRVKNNLQIVSSLLDLQSESIQEPATLELFRESQNRVKSMALVHEKLYQSKDFTRVNFAEYVENLISYLFRAYGVSEDHIYLNLDIAQVTLNIDTAIPCGLIVSELVSNALKYAFLDNLQGLISISLRSNESNNFLLIVKDDGRGMPIDFDFKSVKSLGLQLVNILTKQLKGTLELDRHNGTEFRVSFSEIIRKREQSQQE
ncbi:MAG TPA: hypothetical protein DCP31_22265 [Cyanobacteria bacterium UBA8543]|nr:hypothetical protein [Cyanobacteria bacterium UBA8543]